MLKQLRARLLRISRVQQAVADYKLRQKKKRHHERLEKLMKSSGMIH